MSVQTPSTPPALPSISSPTPSFTTAPKADVPKADAKNAPKPAATLKKADASPLLSPYTGEKLTWDWRGYDIKYVAYGEGPPIVLLHGFGAAIGHWRKNIPELAAAGHRVYALDILGFGDSDKPDLDYSLEFWVKLIHDFWQAHVKAPAVFVGNSIGALMALMTLVTYPKTASGGVLLNCAGSLNHRPEDLPGALRFVMGAFTKLVSSQLTGPVLFDQVRTRGRIRGSLKQVYGNRKAITPELIDFLRNRAPSWIYTTGLSPADAASALGAIAQLNQQPYRLTQLHQNACYLAQQLDHLLAELPSSQTQQLKRLPTDSAIVCLQVKDAATVLALGQQLRAQDIFVSAVRPPTVPISRLRMSVMATHTTDHLDRCIAALRQCLKR
ncbi:MAG: alpha/beta fold hydrolase [Cyanobacteria bacterium J06614_10]